MPRTARIQRRSTGKANVLPRATIPAPTCHHLVKAEEYLAAMLLSWANIAFYQELMAAMRKAIAEGRFCGLGRRHQGRAELGHALSFAEAQSQSRAIGPRRSGQAL